MSVSGQAAWRHAVEPAPVGPRLVEPEAGLGDLLLDGEEPAVALAQVAVGEVEAEEGDVRVRGGRRRSPASPTPRRRSACPGRWRGSPAPPCSGSAGAARRGSAGRGSTRPPATSTSERSAAHSCIGGTSVAPAPASRSQNRRTGVPRWSVGYRRHSSSRLSSWFIPARNAATKRGFVSSSVTESGGIASTPGSRRRAVVAGEQPERRARRAPGTP